MTTLEILVAARALIADPARWTQMANARSVRGRSVLIKSPSAVAFCALGACYRVAPLHSTAEAVWALDSAAESAGQYSTLYLNDNADHAAVLRMFDLAIEREQAKTDGAS